MPLASIIIPVYKAEQYIADCLRSILQQTVSDFEVICIDDGSPDESAAIVAGFAEQDSRIRLLRQPNAGASAARNAGYAAATAGYVTFVDADDHVSPEYLETLVTAIETHQADVALANKYVRNGTKVAPRKPLVSDAILDGGDFRSNGIFTLNAPHAKLYRRSFLDQHRIRYFEGITYEDYVYWVDCLAKRPKVATSSKIIYTYNKNPESISALDQKLKPYNLHSRMVQTDECLRIAAESGVEGMEDFVFRLQFGGRVLRHVHAFTRLKDRQQREEAFALLKKALQPHRTSLLKRFFGWRRLVYKILLDGDLHDLIKVLRFVQGKGQLKLELGQVSGKTKLFVAGNQLSSLEGEKRILFDVSDALRLNEVR